MVVHYHVPSLKLGQRVNLVVETVMLFCEGKHIFRIMGTTQLVILEGDLPFEAVQIWTILQGAVSKLGPLTINIDDGATLIPHRPLLMHDALRCVELCSGAGFMSTGAEVAGFSACLGVEQNANFTRLFFANHPDGAKFLHGNIGDPKTIKHALEMDCQGAVVFAGVSCQPYSTGGDKLSAADPRAQSLPQALQFAWLMQAPAIILECAPAALHDPFVQETIRVFAFEAGFCVRQKILHLDRCWGAKRDRWWALLTATPIGPVDFDDLPIQPMYQKVASVMPCVMDLPYSHQDELLLTLHELGKFQQYSRGLRTLFVDFSRPLPTALHAWGNQIYPCACGCRAGFSEARLQCRGLYAVLVPTGALVIHQGCQLPQCRHMHPSEVALLCGAKPDLDWNSECRLGLSAVGQMASPIQAMWVAGHLRQALDRFVQQAESPDPAQLIRDWCQELMCIRDRLWPMQSVQTKVVQPVTERATIAVEVKRSFDSAPESLKAHDGMTVRDLLVAEELVQQSNTPLHAFDITGQHLPQETPLTPGLHVEVRQQVDPWAEALAADSPIVSAIIEKPVQICKALEEALARDLDLPLDLPPGFEAASRPDASTSVIADEAVLYERDHSFRVGASHLGASVLPEHGGARLQFGSQEALCNLQQPGLLQMLYPHVDSSDALAGLFQQTMDKEVRQQILRNQGMLWADDEIRFHLQQLQVRAPEDQHLEAWDPLSLSSSLKHGGCQWISTENCHKHSTRTIVSVACIHSHWIPVMWRLDQAKLYGFTYNTNPVQLALIQGFHDCLCSAFDCQDAGLVVRDTLLTHSTGCGPIAIDFLHHMVFRSELCAEVDRLYQMHAHLRSVFVDSLDVHTPRPWIWGQGQEVRTQLLAILRQHGVSAEDVESRMDMLYSKIGKTEITKAIMSGQPWKELKWAANQLTPPVQIVRPQELQQAIGQRASQAQPVGRKRDKNKGKGKGKQDKSLQTLNIDPKGLRLADGIFELEDGQPITQVALSDIGPFTAGVILATYQESLPYLQGGKQISGSGLGIAIMDPPKDFVASLPSERISFPVICAANSEPLIVDTMVVQFGKQRVRKATSNNVVELKSIATCVAKCVVFRDEWEGEWGVFVQHPMKCIIQALGILMVCDDVECDHKCGRWHRDPKIDITDPILGVWNRQWLTSTYAMVAPLESDLYTVTLRLPASLEEAMQNLSGYKGLYVEPKGLDGRSVSSAHQVIWLPKSTVSQARMHAQTVPGVIGLARLGSKYGLRCYHKDSQSVHQEVKPNTQFLPSGSKAVYLVGPVPWGTLKASLSTAFQDFGWPCRPLNAIPAGKDVAGIMWKVQAVSPPPRNVLHLQGGDAVITRWDPPQPQVQDASFPVIGSSQSNQLVTKQGGGKGPDMLQLNDPWASYGSVPRQAPVPAADALANLEQKVVTQVMSKMVKPMECDDDHTNQRVQDLEAKVNALHDQQSRLQLTVNEHATNHQAQLSQMQSQFQAQHHRLEKTVSDQSVQLSGLTGQLAKQLEKQQVQLDQMFNQQLSRFEDLLAKKPRHE